MGNWISGLEMAQKWESCRSNRFVSLCWRVLMSTVYQKISVGGFYSISSEVTLVRKASCEPFRNNLEFDVTSFIRWKCRCISSQYQASDTTT